MKPKIKRVLIVGGTHGNERIGVYTIKKFQQNPYLIERSSFKTELLFGNPQAIAANTRYIDVDLNRCFNVQNHDQHDSPQYEYQRTSEILNQWGAAGTMPVDFIIDQHGTTSNAGVMLILDQLDPFTLRLAAHLSSQQPHIKIYSSATSGRKLDSLRSIAPYRIGIEVGPVAHGTLHAELFQKTEQVIYESLDYLDTYNNAPSLLPLNTTLTVYQYRDAIDYPRNQTGEILAMIHPQLQFQDYQPLAPGDPMFLTFDGETIAYQGEEVVYPVFINEAAYYEKNIAMLFTQKQHLHMDARE